MNIPSLWPLQCLHKVSMRLIQNQKGTVIHSQDIRSCSAFRLLGGNVGSAVLGNNRMYENVRRRSMKQNFKKQIIDYHIPGLKCTKSMQTQAYYPRIVNLTLSNSTSSFHNKCFIISLLSLN